MHRVLAFACVIALLHPATALSIDWPEDECPTDGGLIQNGDFSLKEGVGVGLTNQEAFRDLDVCFWETNYNPWSGSMNRNARLDSVLDGEEEFRYARLFHAVHLAAPNWRDPSFVRQEFPEPLAPGIYDINTTVWNASTSSDLGVLIGLTEAPLTADGALTHIFGNPVHYENVDEVAALFDQVVYLSPDNNITDEPVDLSVTFAVGNDNLKHLYILPIKHGEFTGLKAKIIDILYLDDVSMNFLGAPDNVCGVVPTSLAPQPVLTAEGDGVAQFWDAGDTIPLDGIEDTPPLNLSGWDDGIYVHRIGGGIVDFVSMDNETYTEAELFLMFAFVNAEVTNIEQFSGGHTWVTYTCETCELSGDLNGDGVVDLLDLAILEDDFGCWGDFDGCVGDIDGNGVTNAHDLIAFNQQFGMSCPNIVTGIEPDDPKLPPKTLPKAVRVKQR